MFTMRFHMRSTLDGVPTADLYQATLEMAAWAEARGDPRCRVRAPRLWPLGRRHFR